MTYLALRFSGYVNGVAMRHGEVSRGMFPNYDISAITNGVHALTWTSAAFGELFDNYISGWRTDNNYLRYAISIPLADIREAHAKAKEELFAEIRHRTGVALDPKVFTMGFARRASTYKRADLLFHDRERLKHIARDVGPIQLVYAGKAHPRDDGGKKIIRQVFEGAASLSDVIRTVYVENYDMHWGRLITSGVDFWLNTPMRPQEASGTSGMKAALNGVPSFSVIDGWWAEGWIEGSPGGLSATPTWWKTPLRGRHAVRQARAANSANVLRDSEPLHGGDALGHRPEWLVLQHPAHGPAIPGERLHAARSTPATTRPKQAIPALTSE